MRIRSFSIRPPRHPLLRALVLLGGAVVMAVVVVMGVLVGAAVMVATVAMLALRRWLGTRRRGGADPDIIEGEYTVVSRPRAALPHGD